MPTRNKQQKHSSIGADTSVLHKKSKQILSNTYAYLIELHVIKTTPTNSSITYA